MRLVREAIACTREERKFEDKEGIQFLLRTSSDDFKNYFEAYGIQTAKFVDLTARVFRQTST